MKSIYQSVLPVCVCVLMKGSIGALLISGYKVRYWRLWWLIPEYRYRLCNTGINMISFLKPAVFRYPRVRYYLSTAGIYNLMQWCEKRYICIILRWNMANDKLNRMTLNEIYLLVVCPSCLCLRVDERLAVSVRCRDVVRSWIARMWSTLDSCGTRNAQMCVTFEVLSRQSRWRFIQMM